MKFGNVALGVLVAVVWGFNFVVADEAVADVPPFLLVALRYLVVAVLFMPFTRRAGLAWKYIVAVGLLYGVVQFSGLFLGLKLGVSAGVSATVIQSQALLTIVLAWFFLDEKFGALQWAGLAISGTGLTVLSVSGGENAPLLGVTCVLIGAAGWACSNIVLRKAGKISPWTMTVWQSVAVIPPMLALSLIFEHGQVGTVTHMRLDTFGALLYIAVLATGLGNYLWYRLIQQEGASKVAPFSLLVPVVGVVAGWIVLDQALSTRQSIGVVVILVGLALIVLAPQLRARFAPHKEPGKEAGNEETTAQPGAVEAITE
jgi:O-acetylserine/cysteine efflux transporter